MTAVGSMRGIVAMIGAMMMFITNDMLIKLSLMSLPMSEILTLRSLVAVVVLVAVILVSGEGRAIHLALRPPVLVRSGFDAFTTFTYVLALGLLPIATATTIYMVAPLITTALAVPLLGEKVGAKRWAAIFVGFSGAVIVTHPDPRTFVLVALLPLLAAFTGSLRDISTRSISMQVPGSVVALSTALCLSAVSIVCSGWETWSMPSLAPSLYILGSGFAFGVGNVMLVYAFRNAPVAAISPLRYVLVPCALFYSYFIFSHVPDVWGVVGTVLVVGAGLYSIQQEARRLHDDVRARKLEAATAPSGAPIAAAGVTCAPPRS